MNKENTAKTKKILGIILNIVLWIFVIFCVLITVVAFSASSNAKNIPTLGGKSYLTVATDSMEGPLPTWLEGESTSYYSGFDKGDLIISKYVAEDESAIDSIKVGDIVTFEWDINDDGIKEYNTHRVKSIDRNATTGSIISVTTVGDKTSELERQDIWDAKKAKAQESSANPTEEEIASQVLTDDEIKAIEGKYTKEIVTRAKILAVYTGTKASGLGSALSFLSSQLGFGLCVLLPMILFFIYELVVFIMTLVKVKNKGKKTITAADEEVIKQRAIEEYLRKQQAESASIDESVENTAENNENSENNENND